MLTPLSGTNLCVSHRHGPPELGADAADVFESLASSAGYDDLKAAGAFGDSSNDG